MRDISSLRRDRAEERPGATVRKPKKPPSQGNLLAGLLAGLAAAAAGGILWMFVGLLLNMRLGIVAIVVGAMVGSAIRWAGRGHSIEFGVLGALLTLGGCVLGQVLFQIALNARAHGMEFAAELNWDSPLTVFHQAFAYMTPMTYLIYFIGICAGFRRSMIMDSSL